MLVVVGLVLRAWATFSGFFYWDDYLLAGRAARIGLSADLLLHDHDGHFTPGAMLVTWVVTRLSPMSFTFPAVVMILGQVAAAVLFLGLLVAIFGPRRLVLVPLALFVLSPLTLPSTVWFSAALNLLPMQIAGCLLGLSLVRNAREPARRHVVGAATAYAFGVLFFEKSVLLLAVAAGLAWLMADPSVPGALRRTWQRQSALAMTPAVLTLAYLVLYTARMSPRTRLPDSPSVLWDTVRRGLADTVGPALVGGPVRWTPVGWGAAITDPPGWLVWLASAGVVAFVGITSWLRRRARVAWALAGAYLLLDLAVFALTRSAGPAGALVVQSLRYTADASIVLGLAVGWALMPPLGAPDDARAARAATRLASRRRGLSVHPDLARRRRASVHHTGRQVTGRRRPVGSPARPARAHLRAVRAREAISPGLVGVRAPGPAAEDRSAHLAAAGPRRSGAPGASGGPGPSCTRRTGGGLRVARPPIRGHPLGRPALRVGLDRRLLYLAGAPTRGTVQVGYGRVYDVRFRRGLNDMFLSANGGGQDIRIRLEAPGTTACVGDATVGLVSRAGS